MESGNSSERTYFPCVLFYVLYTLLPFVFTYCKYISTVASKSDNLY